MLNRVRFFLAQVLWDLRAGLLLVPGMITAVFAVAGAALPLIERRYPFISRAVETVPLLEAGEPGAAQTLLATIAGSEMTVVAVTYSVLLMVLSLASVQFSPRILVGFVRDRVSQVTVGVFIGTFTYCLVVLRAIRSEPLFVPPVSVSFGLLSALGSLGCLVYFVHHIAYGIQANVLVDGIAAHTEEVIDEVFVLPWTDEPAEAQPQPPEGSVAVFATTSGYVQLFDDVELIRLADRHGVTVYSQRAPGEFVPERAPLVFIHPPERATPEILESCRKAFDLGSVRTMQQDVEYGIRQIVDIALKAVSPAVNDPSTANTCVDHLTRLMLRMSCRRDPVETVRDAKGRLLLVIRLTTFARVLDLAFNQIRQYTRTDMSVSLRMLRRLDDIARATSDPKRLAQVVRQGRMVYEGCKDAFVEGDREELEARKDALLARLPAGGA
jgi:uncharacterized membrane protein